MQNPLRVGRQAVPAPVQLGISPRAVARQRNPQFESIPPVALRLRGSFKFAIGFGVLRSRTQSRIKWQWRLATAPRAVRSQGRAASEQPAQ